MSSTTPRTALFVRIVAIAIATTVGMIVWSKSKPKPPHPVPILRQDASQIEMCVPGSRHRSIVVLSPKEDAEGFNRTSMTVAQEQDAVVVAVNAFLEKVPAVPTDARVIRCSLDEGLAEIEFSNAFDRSYGSDAEAMIIKGILMSVGQFDEIRKSHLLINGEPLKVGLGNVDISLPQEVLRK